MIPFIILAPLAIAGGGLFGLVEERFRRKRLAAQVASQTTPDSPSDTEKQDAPVMASGDLIQIKRSALAARTALGLSAAGIWYPPLLLVSVPIIGYSAYNWLRTRYLFEKPLLKSPLSILASLALLGSLATGNWLMASLVLSVDLSGRKWISQWTEGSRLIDNDTGKEVVPSGFMDRVKYLSKVMLQGEPRWEWFPVLLTRVSMGLFFAISGWNKLFTVAHWQGLLAGMIATGLPFPKLMALFLAWFEFVGGSLLTVGFMSTFFSIGLAFAMIVAIVTVEIPFVIPPGLGPLDWLDWFLYLPQVLYVLIFLWLIIKGPGPYSADAVIARKLGFDKDSEEDPSMDSEKSAPKDSETDSETDSEKNPDKESGPIGLGGNSWTPQYT